MSIVYALALLHFYIVTAFIASWFWERLQLWRVAKRRKEERETFDRKARNFEIKNRMLTEVCYLCEGSGATYSKPGRLIECPYCSGVGLVSASTMHNQKENINNWSKDDTWKNRKPK